MPFEGVINWIRTSRNVHLVFLNKPQYLCSLNNICFLEGHLIIWFGFNSSYLEGEDSCDV